MSKQVKQSGSSPEDSKAGISKARQQLDTTDFDYRTPCFQGCSLAFVTRRSYISVAVEAGN